MKKLSVRKTKENNKIVSTLLEDDSKVELENGTYILEKENGYYIFNKNRIQVQVIVEEKESSLFVDIYLHPCSGFRYMISILKYISEKRNKDMFLMDDSEDMVIKKRIFNFFKGKRYDYPEIIKENRQKIRTITSFNCNGEEYEVVFKNDYITTFHLVKDDIGYVDLCCIIDEDILDVIWIWQDKDKKGLARSFYVDYLLKRGIKEIRSGYIMTTDAFPMWKKMANREDVRFYNDDINGKKEVPKCEIDNTFSSNTTSRFIIENKDK